MKKLNSSSILSALFLLGILIMVNAIGIRIFLRADLTSSKMYSLSEASKDMVRNVEDKIVVKAYFSQNLPGNFAGIERYLRDMLEDYRAYSRGHFDNEFINPGSEEKLVEEAQSFQIPPQQIQAIANDKIEVIRAYMGIVFIYGDKKETIPVVQNIGNLEYEITSLINRLTTTRQTIVGIASTGTEQEKATMQRLYEALARNYNVQPVNMDEPIPEGTDSVLLIAPQQPLTDWQIFNIDQYIMNGGKVGMFMNWYRADIQMAQQAMPIALNINGLLNNYGLGLGEDMLSDANSATVGMQSRQGLYTMTHQVKFPYFPIIQSFNRDHVISRDLQRLQTYYPSSVDTSLAVEKGFKVNTLFYTSGHATRDTGPFVYLDPLRRRAEVDFPESFVPVAATVQGTFTSFFAESGPPEKNNADEEYNGPFKASADAENRLLLVGDGHIGLDQYMDGGSLMFIQNAIDWLIQSEGLIAIRSKQIPMKPLKEVPTVVRKLVRWANLFGPTILIIVVGIALWQVRRIRKKALMAQ